MTARQKVWDFLNKNSTSIYVLAFCVIISTLIMFVQEIKHTSEMLKTHAQTLVITGELKRQMNLSKEKDEFMNFQSEILHKQRERLEKTDYALGEQETIIRQLIQYLKSIKHWPPKIEPVDPGSIARARSEA